MIWLICARNKWNKSLNFNCNPFLMPICVSHYFCIPLSYCFAIFNAPTRCTAHTYKCGAIFHSSSIHLPLKFSIQHNAFSYWIFIARHKHLAVGKKRANNQPFNFISNEILLEVSVNLFTFISIRMLNTNSSVEKSDCKKAIKSLKL